MHGGGVNQGNLHKINMLDESGDRSRVTLILFICSVSKAFSVLVSVDNMIERYAIILACYMDKGAELA